MQLDENNAIRYLMKEMDPSEEMEFEKQMREDENLLIEVESLRATNRRLSGLPLINPPKQLTQKIANEAKQLQTSKLNKSKKIPFLLKRGIAAAFLLAAFSGGYFYLWDSPAVTETAKAAGAGAVNTEEVIEPWVDRNDVLKFPENIQSVGSSALEAEFSKSYNKLQLVNDPQSGNTGSKGIMLTGSSK